MKRRGAGRVLARPSVQAARSSRRSKRSRRPLVKKDPPTPTQEALEPLFVLSSRYQIYLVTRLPVDSDPLEAAVSLTLTLTLTLTLALAHNPSPLDLAHSHSP